MKQALIIGISGNFGWHMGKSLHQAGWQVQVLTRDINSIPEWLGINDVIVGDVRDSTTLKQAAKGQDLIVYGANPAYHQWVGNAMAMLEGVIDVVTENRQHLLFPGNVYGFAPQDFLINETTLPKPPTEKGKIRVMMEQRLAEAAQQGAKVTIVRAGDFFGPDMHMSWLHMILKIEQNRLVYQAPHDEHHQHHWSYLPDLCANTVALLEQGTEDFTIYHDPGFLLTTEDFAKVSQQLGKKFYSKRLPWAIYRVIALFSPLLKEVLKMRYLWQQPVLLDGERMKQALGARYQTTPLAEALSVSLQKRAK